VKESESHHPGLNLHGSSLLLSPRINHIDR